MNKTRKNIAIEALSHGESIEKVSELTSVTRQTIYNWLSRDDFQRKLRERQSSIFQQLSKRLLSITTQALSVLEESLYSRNERVRLRASQIALSNLKSVVDMTDFEERLTVLENKNKGQ